MAVIHCSLVLTFCVRPLLITVSVPDTGCGSERERERERGERGERRDFSFHSTHFIYVMAVIY